MLCTPIWYRNYNELGGLRFVVQCTLHPKNGDEPGGLRGVDGVLQHALHPDVVQEQR